MGTTTLRATVRRDALEAYRAETDPVGSVGHDQVDLRGLRGLGERVLPGLLGHALARRVLLLRQLELLRRSADLAPGDARHPPIIAPRLRQLAAA